MRRTFRLGIPRATRRGLATLPLAQVVHLRRQVPLLYVLLTVNTLTMAWDYHQFTPVWLTGLIPVGLIVVILLRLGSWLRLPTEPGQLTLADARRCLRSTEMSALFLAICFSLWAIKVDSYAPPEVHGEFLFYAAITLMGTTSCLNYLPRAAYLACGTLLAVLLPYCLWTGPSTLIEVAIDVLLVGIVTLLVMEGSFAAFVELEHSRHELGAERTQAQLLNSENARLALTDPLTHLPNRRSFFAHLDAILARAEPTQPFCVTVLDLDRFKPINDSLGHAQGDRLLDVIGQRLRAQASPALMVARLGGDEFGAIIDAQPDAAEAVVRRLCAVIEQPVDLRDVTVSVGCSAGIAPWPEAGTRAHGLYDRADFALYHAKKSGRGKVVRFSATLEQMIRSEQALELALQAADLERELDVVFQPVVSTRTMEIAAIEALARWTSHTLGSVPAELLITTADKLGLSGAVTLTLFDKVLAQFSALPAPIRMAFNLSATDLDDDDTTAALIARMNAMPEARGRIVFEITETSLIKDFARVSATLQRLRAAGARIALDDFGTGFSSLSTLHQLPLDMIKVDRSFAGRLGDPHGRRFVMAIRQLAAALDLGAVFEGIETEAQLIEATLAGFPFVQGYFLARPGTLASALTFGDAAEAANGNHPPARHVA